MRVKLTVSYDGTNFSGWQVQQNKRSVQGEIENAIFKLTGETVRVTGSGRTDAGVHAKSMGAHFDTQSKIPAQKFTYALNVILPEDVKILNSEQASEDFNARKSAKSKTYVYSVYQSKIEQPLLERYSVKVLEGHDVEKMNKACKLFIGEHDFKAFSSTGSSVKTTTRTVYDFSVKSEGERIEFSVSGNGFLYNMVRIMVGTLLEIGKGDRNEKDIEKAFTTGDRKLAGKTVKAKGLTLKCVEY